MKHRLLAALVPGEAGECLIHNLNELRLHHFDVSIGPVVGVAGEVSDQPGSGRGPLPGTVREFVCVPWPWVLLSY